jgi:hypothetical protein
MPKNRIPTGRPRGRPPLSKIEPSEARNVSLTKSDWAYLKKIGCGNISAGVRVLVSRERRLAESKRPYYVIQWKTPKMLGFKTLQYLKWWDYAEAHATMGHMKRRAKPNRIWRLALKPPKEPEFPESST